MMGYIALNDASTLLRLPDGAQGVRMKLDDIFAAPQVSQEIVRDLPGNFYASDWTYTHGNLFSAIQMEKAMVSLLLFLIVLVAAFNIVSSLVMVVTDKNPTSQFYVLWVLHLPRLPESLWFKVL